MLLGLDASTQSLTAVVLDPEAGRVVFEDSVNFGTELPAYGAPSGFIPDGAEGEVHANPLMWLDALDRLMGRLAAAVDLKQVRKIAGSGQQHGSVYLGRDFERVLAGLDPSLGLAAQIAPVLARPTSPIWMDTSTGAQCREIAAALGGDAEVCRRSGSVATERFTGPQIRRFHQREPQAYAATSRIHLVSSFLASVLAGRQAAIDYGDAAGMNLLDLGSLEWDPDLLAATAPELAEKLPVPAPTTAVIGAISPYFARKYGFAPDCGCALWSGDNPASLVGMGATAPGQMVISLGTSDTLFAAMPGPRTDPAGYGHVFGNPAGGFMSLICFRNGSLAREALRDRLGLGWEAFERAALESTREAAGSNLMLPFFGPEITPRRDFDGPRRRGSAEFEAGHDAGLQVRALLEGQFLNMRLHARWMDLRPERIRLTGGASRNDGIARTVADVFQAPVERLEAANSAALGAALVAGAAAGLDLTSLQGTFCRATPGTALQPDRSLAPVYDAALVRFEAFLGEA